MNKSHAVIGYPSWQDGAVLPARDTGLVPQGKFIMFWCFILYNKYFIIIDQACSVKMAGYWPSSFLRVYGPRLRPHAWSITHTYYMVLSHKDWELPNSRI